MNISNYFFPKEQIQIDFDFEKDTFVNRFKEHIDSDRGYFTDEFFISKKEYLGKINSTEFVVRIKRKFLHMNISPSYAKGNISGDEKKTNIDVELYGNDEFNAFGKIVAHLFFLILNIVIIVNGVYSLLILFIPFSIAILTLIHFLQIRRTRKFKKNFLNIMNELRSKKNVLQHP